jgi:hypothetical protein
MSRTKFLLLIEPLSLQQLLGKVDRVPMGASEELFRPKKRRSCSQRPSGWGRVAGAGRLISCSASIFMPWCPSAPLNCLQVRGEGERRTHGPAAAELEMVDLHRSSTTARAY